MNARTDLVPCTLCREGDPKCCARIDCPAELLSNIESILHASIARNTPPAERLRVLPTFDIEDFDERAEDFSRDSYGPSLDERADAGRG